MTDLAHKLETAIIVKQVSLSFASVQVQQCHWVRFISLLSMETAVRPHILLRSAGISVGTETGVTWLTTARVSPQVGPSQWAPHTCGHTCGHMANDEGQRQWWG